MHFAAANKSTSGNLHDPRAGIFPRQGQENGKLLESNASAQAPADWHECSDKTGMIPLLLAFFLVAAAICALVSLDRQSGAEAEAIERDPLELKYSPSTGGEFLPRLTVGTNHTVAGLARGK